MDMQSYIDEIKLKLTGGVLDLELDDSTLQKVVNAAFREVQRYIDSTRLATIPFKSCIDLSDCHVSSVSRVFRSQSYQNSDASDGSVSMFDPLAASQWQLLSGSGLYNLNDYVYRYATWNSLLQLRNTTSTDLLFRFDRHTNYLYINVIDKPQFITIEYVPRYDSVDEVVSDYWIDKIVQLATALTKVTLGRIRSRYTQSNALWTQDGETLLQEGNEELNTLREELRTNHQLVYPID